MIIIRIYMAYPKVITPPRSSIYLGPLYLVASCWLVR